MYIQVPMVNGQKATINPSSSNGAVLTDILHVNFLSETVKMTRVE
jgi:hypothetical protein